MIQFSEHHHKFDLDIVLHTMGYDVARFVGEISEELICSICSEILENPLTTDCEHLFCRECINDWLRDNHTCPIDRLYVHQRTLKPAPRTIR